MDSRGDIRRFQARWRTGVAVAPHVYDTAGADGRGGPYRIARLRSPLQLAIWQNRVQMMIVATDINRRRQRRRPGKRR